MKIIISVLLVCVFSACAFGQAKEMMGRKGHLQVEVTENGATSELLPIPLAVTPHLPSAEIGIKYFGVQSDSDISVLLILKGTKNLYSSKENFGVRLYSDDVPLSQTKYRKINSVDKDADTETLHFYLKSEDLAWLAASKSLRIESYLVDSEKKHHTFTFDEAALAEFKSFAKSVFLIRSHLN